MKNFEQRKAEIFRRSEDRINQRKRKRNRVIAVCIPAFICIATLSVAILTKINPVKNDFALEDNFGTIENDIAVGSIVCSYTEVEVKTDDNSHNQRFTDKVQVTQIFSCVQTLYNADGSASDADDSIKQSTETKDENKSSADSLNLGYTLTFITEDGSKTVYTLKGNKLKESSTNQTLTLTESQLSKLKAVLGLSE